MTAAQSDRPYAGLSDAELKASIAENLDLQALASRHRARRTLGNLRQTMAALLAERDLRDIEGLPF